MLVIITNILFYILCSIFAYKYVTNRLLHSVNPNYPVMRFDSDQRVFLIGRVLRPIKKDEIASV